MRALAVVSAIMLATLSADHTSLLAQTTTAVPAIPDSPAGRQFPKIIAARPM